MQVFQLDFSFGFQFGEVKEFFICFGLEVDILSCRIKCVFQYYSKDNFKQGGSQDVILIYFVLYVESCCC